MKNRRTLIVLACTLSLIAVVAQSEAPAAPDGAFRDATDPVGNEHVDSNEHVGADDFGATTAPTPEGTELAATPTNGADETGAYEEQGGRETNGADETGACEEHGGRETNDSDETGAYEEHDANKGSAPSQNVDAAPGQDANAEPGQDANAEPGQDANAEPGQDAKAAPGQSANAAPEPDLADDFLDPLDEDLLLEPVEFTRAPTRESIRNDLMHERAERTSQHLRVNSESFQSARDLGDLLQRSTEYAPAGNQMPMPSIEGLSGAHVDVLIDGLPAASRIQTRNGPAVDLGMIPVDPADVERIDIYQGIGPAGSGDGSGVILDVITRDDLEPGFSARAETIFGDEGFHGYDLRGSVRLRPSDDLLITSGVHTLYTPSFDADDDGVRDSTRERTFSAQSSMRWRRSDDEQTLVAADFTTRSTELPSATGPPNLMDRYQVRVRARNVSPLPDGWSLDSSLSFGVLSDEYSKSPDDVSPPAIISDNRVADGTGALYFKRAFGPVDLGLELCGNGQGVGLVDARGVRTEHTEGQVCAAASAHWWASDGFDLNARALAAYHSEFGGRGVGGLTLTGRPSRRWALRASADYTERVPTSEERYQLFFGYIILEGNRDLQPEKTLSTRGSVSYATRSDAFGIELAGFAHFQRERVEPKLVETAATSPYGEAVYQYINVARARTAGTRLEVRASAAPVGLDFIARYTWLPVLQNLTSGETLELQSHHAFLGILEGEWLDKRLQAWTSLGLRSGQTWTGGNVGAPPQGARPIWNVGVASQVHEYVQVRAEATNMLDITDPYWGPYAGWEVRTSLRFDLYYSGNNE